MPGQEAGDNFYLQEGSEDWCLGKYLFGMCTHLLQEAQVLHLRRPERLILLFLLLGYNVKKKQQETGGLYFGSQKEGTVHHDGDVVLTVA